MTTPENTTRAAATPDGHRQRLRERFLASGLDGFHDYEVVELLLTLNTPRKDCKAAAKSAMARFKTLSAVLDADPDQLCEIPGIGPKNMLGIKLIKAVSDRYLEQRVIGKTVLGNSRALFDFLHHYLQGRTRECFLAVFLDARNHVLATEILFEGTLTASAVYPREVVRAALRHNAAALILAHNHPSGVPEPSPEDAVVTKRLIDSCHTMDIQVHDHIVIGDNQYYSFADHGRMAELRNR